MPLGADVTFNTLATLPTRDSPLWRIVITNAWDAATGKDFVAYTTLDKLASDRVVTPMLNAPLMGEFTVPSDNPQVYIPAPLPDGDPYVSEGTRCAFWLRRESETPPYYVVRAATLIQQVEDTAEQDDARTRCVGWDPWQYLMSRPVRVPNLFPNLPTEGELLPEEGVTFLNWTVGDIALQLLTDTIDYDGQCFIDPFGGEYADATATLAKFTIPQGMSVGQAWAALTATGLCDIVLTPRYDPTDYTCFLANFNLYSKAGVERPSQTFAWNMPGRTLTQISRLQDGTSRANNVKMFSGQGGVSETQAQRDAPAASDAISIAKYRAYWAQQFLPGNIQPVAVNALAEFQLSLRKNGRETVTISPAPERSPRPFQDYQLGDRVPVFASGSPNVTPYSFARGTGGFRQALGSAYNVGSGEDEVQFARIYGFPIDISDDALETVRSMIIVQNESFSPSTAGVEIVLAPSPSNSSPRRRGTVVTT